MNLPDKHHIWRYMPWQPLGNSHMFKNAWSVILNLLPTVLWEVSLSPTTTRVLKTNQTNKQDLVCVFECAWCKPTGTSQMHRQGQSGGDKTTEDNRHNHHCVLHSYARQAEINNETEMLLLTGRPVWIENNRSTCGVSTQKDMEKKFFLKQKKWRNSHIPTPSPPPLHHPPPLGWAYAHRRGRHWDTVIPLSPPSGRTLILPAVVLLGHWFQQSACSAPLCSALAAACISPTEESAEADMRLHTEQATYSLEELNTHREVLELQGNLQDYSTHWRYYLHAW